MTAECGSPENCRYVVRDASDVLIDVASAGHVGRKRHVFVLVLGAMLCTSAVSAFSTRDFESDINDFTCCVENGGPGRTRTCNQTVMSGRL